ncbi:hypothetical protein BMJ32_13100 [Sinorhizobium medicae]|nr:avidin [Sinorhizobium medicae]PLU02355.1 hypothetical protein BMJ32_13100 [Sinorhizobium medicae]PLU64507.1 hypothetical protein BMJ21_22825 [Sinorhizobium medicae]
MPMLEKALSKTAPSTATANFSGRWQNDLGSTMFLAVSGGRLDGTYTSAESAKGGPITGDVIGFVNGDLISFVVNWPTAAITAWVGQQTEESGTTVLKTLWQMTTNIADAEEPEQLWSSIWAGADIFRR